VSHTHTHTQEQTASLPTSSMDIMSNDSPGEEEAVTAAGPLHHMTLLQQACATAASINDPKPRRSSCLSNTDNANTTLPPSDLAAQCLSSRKSSPSRCVHLAGVVFYCTSLRGFECVFLPQGICSPAWIKLLCTEEECVSPWALNLYDVSLR